MNVILTGASGFIGKSVVRCLSEYGHNVCAVIKDKNKINMFNDLKNVNIVVSDLNNISQLNELTYGNSYDVFFHFAWEGTSGSERENYEVQMSNVKHTCEAVKVAKKLNCKRFVYAGSLMEYESIKYISMSGSKPVLNYIYRTAKLTAHYMAKAVAVDLDMDFITGIISNAYGEGETSPRLINSTVRKLLRGEKTSFTSAEQLYDFIYITDVAKAFVIMAEEGKSYSNYYIGNKKPRKLKEFLLELKNCIDENIELGLGEIPFDGISLDYTEFDTLKLYKDTSFKCEIDFKRGIHKTVNWIKDQYGGK